MQKRSDIKVDMDPGDNQLIEPMLLIPFIENAFKHGTGAHCRSGDRYFTENFRRTD